MSRLTWGAVGTRTYEAGVDRGVLFPTPSTAVVWDGLVNIIEKTPGGSARPYFVNGRKYLQDPAPQDFEASVEAFTYPDEFAPLDGTASNGKGLSFGLQRRKEFGLSYRTQLGNDITDSAGYRIHLVYNAMASPSEKGYKTRGATADPTHFKWDLSTRAAKIAGRRATAHVFIDSTATDPGLLSYLEAIIYGAQGMSPRMPSMDELSSIFDNWDNPTVQRFLGKFGSTPRRVTNLFTVPSFELATGGLNDVRINTCVNPNPSVITGYQGPGIVSVSAPWNPARFAAQAVSTGAATPYIFSANSNRAWSIGERILLKAKVRADRGYTVRAHVNTNNVYFPEGQVTVSDADAKTWREVTILLTMTRAVTSAEGFNVGVVSTAASGTQGDVIQMGDVLIEASPVDQPFFDGGTSAEGDFVYSWAGTAGLTASIKRGPGVLDLGSHVSLYTAIQSSEWASSGSKSVRVIPKGVSADNFASLPNAFFKAGTTYTIKAKFRLTQPQANPSVNARRFYIYDGSVTFSPQLPNVAGVQELVFEYTPKAAVTIFRAMMGVSAGDTDLWLDDMIVYEGTDVVAYFDGSFEKSVHKNQEVFPVWDGTPHRSSSSFVYIEELTKRGRDGDAIMIDEVMYISKNGVWQRKGNLPMRAA